MTPARKPRRPRSDVVLRRFMAGWTVQHIADYERRFDVLRQPPWCAWEVESALRWAFKGKPRKRRRTKHE